LIEDLGTLQDVISDRLRQVNTSLPGRIEKYNASTRLAEVKPLIREKYADGTVLSLAPITNVPVIMPSTADAGLALPVAAGDTVLLLFCQRSIDRWAVVGGEVNAEDVRMHAMSDAVAVAGLFDFTVTHTDGAGLVLYNGAAKIRVTSDGKVAIGTAVVELLDEITKALDDIVTGLAAIPYTATATAAASAAIKTIKGSI